MAKLKYQRKDIKQWAKDNYLGLENTSLPSFSKDLEKLDESAIRHDLRQSIKHGFHKTIIVSDAGVSINELKQWIECVLDENAGRLLVSVYLSLDNTRQIRDILAFSEQAGVDSALMHYPLGESFDNPDDVYEYTKMICDSTDLAIDLYPSHKYNFERFHPSSFALEWIERMVELENVAGMKIGTPDPNVTVEVLTFCRDRVLPAFPVPEFWLPYVTGFGQQWAGSAPYEFMQDTENQQLVSYLAKLRSGDIREAQAIYWQITPARLAFTQLILPTLGLGLYNYNLWKYAQWLTGGSGGYVRVPCMKYYEHDKQLLLNAMLASGIKVREEALPDRQ